MNPAKAQMSIQRKECTAYLKWAKVWNALQPKTAFTCSKCCQQIVDLCKMLGPSRRAEPLDPKELRGSECAGVFSIVEDRLRPAINIVWRQQVRHTLANFLEHLQIARDHGDAGIQGFDQWQPVAFGKAGEEQRTRSSKTKGYAVIIKRARSLDTITKSPSVQPCQDMIAGPALASDNNQTRRCSLPLTNEPLPDI